MYNHIEAVTRYFFYFAFEKKKNRFFVNSEFVYFSEKENTTKIIKVLNENYSKTNILM